MAEPGLIYQIADLMREANLVRYLLYSIWLVPILRVYKAFKDRILAVWIPSEEKTKTKNAKIAILIPARNASKYISDVIKSIINQTLKPQLVIIVDDASEDNTFFKASQTIEELGGIVGSIEIRNNMLLGKTYELKDIVFILKRNEKHLGKAKSLNRLLEYTKDFDYVMVLDSDTILENRYIEKLLDVMNDDPKSGAASGLPLLWKSTPSFRLAYWFARAFRESSGLVFALTVKTAASKVKAVATLNGCCLLVKREALMDVKGFPVDTFTEDAELSLKLALKGYQLYFVPEALAYTIDPGSPLGLSRKMFRILRGMYTSFFKTILEMLRKRFWGLSITAFYNIFGGIPLSISLMNLLATTYLVAKGYITSSFLIYIASLLQFSEVSIILNIIAHYPIILIAASYLWGVIGSILALLALSIIYRKSNKSLSKISLSAIRYSLLVPLVLWVQAFVAIPAIAAAIRDLLREVEARW